MKSSSAPGRTWRIQRRDRLHVAIAINQLATPGLGSWIAGHRVAAAGQLVLACGGFVLFLVFCVLMVLGAVRAGDSGAPLEMPAPVWWQSGLGLFGVSWLWAAVTSVQLWIESRRMPPAPPPLASSPPRLE